MNKIWNNTDMPFNEYVQNLLDIQDECRVLCKLVKENASTFVVEMKGEEFYIKKNYTSINPDENDMILCDIRYMMQY